MLLGQTTVPVGLHRIITETDICPRWWFPGYSRDHARVRIPLIKTQTSTKNEPSRGEERGRRGGEGGGEHREKEREREKWRETGGGRRTTYLCRTGTRDSAVPRKTMSPARCALARRSRSSARRWDCCCCFCGDCCSAGPASWASSRAGWRASGPAWSMARTFAYAASSTSFPFSRRVERHRSGFAPPRARARAGKT